MKLQISRLTAISLLCWALPVSAELTIPAFTAYTLPNPDAAHISEQSGVTRWNDPETTVNWFGQFNATGTLNAKVTVRLDKETESKLRMKIGAGSRELTVTGTSEPVIADFGEFQIEKTGFQRVTLESLNPADQNAGNIVSLRFAGSATEGAHFNLKERRNAASVHLGYETPKDLKIAGFYKEVTGITDPSATFYMACGFHRGYFGMQVNSPTERRIIFSVWDSGGEAVDRSKVQADDRVKLVAKGEGVFSGDFGNEGAGGHSHLKYLWKTGDGKWIELTKASFTHDGTGKTDRLDRFMGVEDGDFFLSHGGFIEGFTKYGTSFTRPAKGKAPDDLKLPPLPE